MHGASSTSTVQGRTSSVALCPSLGQTTGRIPTKTLRPGLTKAFRQPLVFGKFNLSFSRIVWSYPVWTLAGTDLSYVYTESIFYRRTAHRRVNYNAMQGGDDAARVTRSFLQHKHPVPRSTVALCQHFNHKPPELPSPSSAESLVATNCNRESFRKPICRNADS